MRPASIYEEKRDEHTTARLASEFCRLVEAGHLIKHGHEFVPAWARDWWEEHKRQDAERLEREEEALRMKRAEEDRLRLQKAALKKLTPDERWALGHDK